MKDLIIEAANLLAVLRKVAKSALQMSIIDKIHRRSFKVK